MSEIPNLQNLYIFLCIFIFFYIIRPLNFDRERRKPLHHPISLTIHTMTFAPPKKASKVQTGKRHGKWLELKTRKVLNSVSLQYDAEGNATGLSHFASPITGEYKGRKVYSVNKTKKVQTIRA